MNDSAVIMEPGIYEHYKGKRYEVIGVGRHTETEEMVVIYRPLYESDVSYWVRPYAMFNDSVFVDGITKPRFSRISA